MSPEARKRISQAQKKRCAAQRGEAATTEAPAPGRKRERKSKAKALHRYEEGAK